MNFDSAVSRTLALRTLIPDSPRLSARRFHPVLLLTLLLAAPATYAQAPPVADAGPDQVVLPGSPVTLDGSGSFDPDIGDTLTYAWTLTPAAGSSATLSDPTAVSPTFTADVAGTYTAQLIVNDGTSPSVPDSVQIIANTPPVANAGTNQSNVPRGSTVTVDGSLSSDDDNDSLDYTWTLTPPAGSSAALSDPTAIKPTFDVDLAGSYEVRLIVNDGIIDSEPDTVFITAVNAAPVADAGPDQSGVAEGATVTLDGSGSSDPDGDPITSYSWTLAPAPGSSATLSDPAAVSPTFVADVSGTYTAQLVVSDGTNVSTPDGVQVIVVNAAPVADAGPDQPNVAKGATVTLDGSNSSDPDPGDTLSYAWTLTRPAGSSAALSNPAAVSPTFVADAVGTYEAQLIVNDGTVDSLPDTVQVSVANSAPLVAISAPSSGLTFNFGTPITFVASATDAEDDDSVLTAGITWSSSVDGALTGTGGSITVSDLSPGVHLITASVVDSDGGAASASISVTINAIPTVTITAPADGSAFDFGTTVDFQASATDAEDNDATLTGQMTWSSSLDGALAGIGGTISASNLSEGAHVITASVTDTDGAPGSASISVTILNTPPTAANVAITGTPIAGEILTGEYTYNDAEGDIEGASIYQWWRNGVRISGATERTYVVAPADKEKNLQFEVTPVAATGASPGDPVLSPELLISNTAPSITGQNVVEIVEDGSREIVLTDLIVTDQDSVFPDDFTLTVQNGQNYTRGGANGNTIFPVLNFNGDLTVPVTVNDGFVESNVFNMVVTVTPVNDAPVFNGLAAPLSTLEDESITIGLNDLNVTDVDADDVYPTGFSLQLQPGPNYTVSGSIVTPALNFSGEISVPATVADPGGLASQEFSIPIAVTAVNDEPVLDTPIADQTAIENSPFSLDVSGNFSDADGDTLTYSATGLPASNNITINAVTGVISGTPRIEDARDNDPYVVTVTARDPDEALTIGTFDLTVSALDRANLALSIDVAPDTGVPSDELRWTFTSLNPQGPQPGSNVELTGSFVGTGLTVAAENGANCDFDAVDDVVTDFVCIIGTLPVGASTPIVITTTTSVATEVVAFATVAGADNLPIDPNDEDNSDLEAAGVAEAFSIGAVQILGSASIRSVAAGDVNTAGEGAIDLVVGTAAGQPVQVYLSDAARESCGCLRDFLLSPISVNDTGANEGVALADFNRDGSLDLVVVNGSGSDRVFVNDGDGNFSPIATLEASFAAAVAVADFNLDGNPDIAVAEIGDLNRVYFGDGLGGFPGGSIRLGTVGRDEANSNDVAAADVNGDGRPDLVFANVGGASTIWLSDPGGGFTLGNRLPVGDALAVAAGDLNGDGRADLVFGRVPSGVGDVPSNPVLLNDGSGGFGAPAELLGISPTNDVHIGDVNNDGSPDLVFINASGVHQVWAANAGGYTLQREQIIDLEARAGVLAHLGFTDTDTPGGLDLAMGGAVAGGVAVYLNDAAGNLGRGDVEPPVITLSGNASVSIESGMTYSDAGATADDNIDGDISADIRVTNSVNTAVVGSYTVSYDVTDFAGNAAATVTRTVNVTPAAGSGGGGGGALSYWTALALLGFLVVAMAGRPQVRAQRVRAHTRKQRILR